MSEQISEFIIVGSGPAGVSAAWPLVLAGRSVVMIEAGEMRVSNSDKHENFSLRQARNGSYGDFFQGKNASKLFHEGFASPKLRASGMDFKRYSELNRLDPVNFTLTGLIETGGLSRVWGASCACYDDDDLGDSPVKLKDLSRSYAEVGTRIGLSGNNLSPIARFIGDYLPLQGQLPLTPLMKRVMSEYARRRKYDGILLGETLSAVTSSSSHSRGACLGDMRCMWGCPHNSIYSADLDLPRLRSFSNFSFQPNIVIDDLLSIRNGTGSNWIVAGLNQSSGECVKFLSQKVFLAMGIFATTRLVIEKFLPKGTSLKVLHNPSFSSAMVIPKFIGGQVPHRGYGGSQLCFKLPLSDTKGDYAFGLIFDAASLPAYELMRHMPFTRLGAINAIRLLMPSMLLLLVYLPPRLSQSRVEMAGDNRLKVYGGYVDGYQEIFSKCVRRMNSFFRQLGIYTLPGSTKGYQPGAEVHYGCTLSSTQFISERSELNNAKGIYIVDGAALPALTAKSHTLTIMANADRIARSFL